MNVSERLAQAGLQLPSPINPLGSYRTVSVSGSQLYVSGLGPFENGKPLVGIVGGDMSLAGSVRGPSDDVDDPGLRRSGMRARKCREMQPTDSYVRAEQSFTQHPQVANGASDLLLTLFGPSKLPARSALGMHTLPMGIPVEIDSIFELKQ